MVDSASNAAGNTPNLGQFTEYTSSLGRVRIDNTGSIEGSTLSQYISIVKRDGKYADDLHSVEVGFSPTHVLDERINNYFIASASGQFNIDDILGDPGYNYSSSYSDLFTSASDIVGDILTGSGTTHRQSGTYVVSGSNNYSDMIRTLKFYDNVVFKSVKDYIPARSSISEGIIIKPHVLERSKAKQLQISGSQLPNSSSQAVADQFIGDITLTGSISINENTGSSGGAFGGQNQLELTIPLTASYVDQVMTSGGLATYTYHNQEEARYDGELSGSVLSSSYFPNELNRANIFKYEGGSDLQYKFKKVDTATDPSPSKTPTPTATPTVTPTPTRTPAATPSKTPSPSPVCTHTGSAKIAHYGSSCYSHTERFVFGTFTAGCDTGIALVDQGCFTPGTLVDTVSYNACQDGTSSDTFGSCSSRKFGIIQGGHPTSGSGGTWDWLGSGSMRALVGNAQRGATCLNPANYQNC